MVWNILKKRGFYKIYSFDTGAAFTGSSFVVRKYEQIQDGINKKAKIGIKALIPELDQTRIDGLIEKMLERWTAVRSVSAV